MKDWEEILKVKLADEQMPLPEGDWEWFETNRLQPMMRRRSLIRWSACITGLAAAASVALFIILPSRKPLMEENKGYISESGYHTTPVMPPEIKENKPVKDELVPARQPRVAENEIVRLEQKQDTSIVPSVPSMESVQKTEKERDSEPVYYEDFVGNLENTFRVEKNRKNSLSFAPLFRSSGGSVSSIGSVYYSSIATAGSSQFDRMKYEDRHYVPISIGVDLRILVGKSLSVTSGVDVSLYRSRFTVDNESMIQNAYYIGIPLRLDCTIWRNGPVSAWIGGGGKVDRLVFGKFGADRIKDNSFNWSIIGDLGIQYDLSKNVGVFFAPEVSYYFKPENPVIQTYRTENPLMFTVGAGLRFSL